MSHITGEIYELLPTELKRQQECAQCGVLFYEMENIGRLRCQLHPGVRLVDEQHRTYYSCCDRGLGWRGCLSVDHCARRFTQDPLETRLSELQTFALYVAPDLLLRYVTPPLNKSILYRLSPFRERLTFRLGALDEAYARFKPLALRHSLLEREKEESPPVPWQPEATRAVSQVLRDLAMSARDSPLFAHHTTEQERRNEQIEQLCNEVWKNPPQRLPSERCPRIPFTIIRRIDDKIDLYS